MNCNKKNLVKIQIWNLCFKWAETETYLSLESSMTNVSPSSDSFMLMYSLIGGKFSGNCNLKIVKKLYFVNYVLGAAQQMLSRKKICKK